MAHPFYFHLSLLKKDVAGREVVDQKIAGQLEFEEAEQPKQQVDLIMDIMVFAEEGVDGRPPGLYYSTHEIGSASRRHLGTCRRGFLSAAATQEISRRRSQQTHYQSSAC